MNPQALIEGIDRFLPFASEKNYLFSWLQIMRAWSADLAVAVAKSIDTKEGGAVHTYLRSIMGEVRAVKARSIFSSIEATAEALRELEATLGGGDEGAAGRTQRLLNRFSESYEHFIENPTSKAIYMLVISADMLRAALVTMVSLLCEVKGRLHGGVEPGEGESKLSLSLPADMSFDEFTEKLCAVRSAHDAAGRLLCGTDMKPLRIAHVASGGMWLCVFGKSEVIALLRQAISRTARWLYEHRAIDPRRGVAIPGGVDGRRVLDLDAVVAAAGLGIGDEELAQVAARLIASAAEIVRGQPEVSIDGEIVSIAEVTRERFLTERVSRD